MNIRADVARCGICGQEYPKTQLVPVETLRPELVGLIENGNPGWRATGYICRDDELKCSHRYIDDMLRNSRVDEVVLADALVSLYVRPETSEETEAEADLPPAIGWRGPIATLGGSWYFLALFSAVIVAWIGLNLLPLLGVRFDPDLFILVNLVLSCVAALQTPFIMISQRSQEAETRRRTQNQYRLAVRAQLEARRPPQEPERPVGPQLIQTQPVAESAPPGMKKCS